MPRVARSRGMARDCGSLHSCEKREKLLPTFPRLLPPLLAMAKEGALAKLLQRLQPWRVSACVCVRVRKGAAARAWRARGASLPHRLLSLSLPLAARHGSGESWAGVRP